MVKKIQKDSASDKKSGAQKSGAQLSGTIKDSASQIWLAGLGAFAKAQEEGGKVFEALVKEGVSLQRKTQAGVEEISRRLTSRGFPVEGTTQIGHEYPNVVVGHVLEVGRHPDADKLSLCKVDGGTGEILNVVCGAPNVRAGMKVPLALVGAELPGGLKIKRSKIRGAVSEGMLCSARELELGGDHSGILALRDDAPVGRPVREMFGEPDTVLEVESDNLTGVRNTLARFEHLRSVAQLGARLHLLVARELADAEAVVQRMLRDAGVEARVTRTTPSLEDVFVVATRERREARRQGERPS